jgi:F0F1-type ATP synthase membrane subunit b/b'
MSGIWSLAPGFLNLALFVGIVAYFAKGAIRGFFQQRADGVAASIKEATRAYEEARSSLELWEKKQAMLEAEVRTIFEHAEKRARSAGEEFVRQAEAYSRRMLEETRLKMETNERDALEARRRTFLKQLTGELKGMLRDRLSEDERYALVRSAIERLASLQQERGKG